MVDSVKTLDTRRQTALLEEYTNCDAKVSRIDTLIWQTASVIFPISLAGFGYFGLAKSHTVSQFLVLLALAAGSITLLITWYLLSRAWYGYQRLAFYRMREIETELDLWHYRYAKYLRLSKADRRELLSNEARQKMSERLTILEESVPDIPGVGLSMTIKVITGIFLVGWIALLVRELILTF